tara:strand:- start:413 stop:1507 length:1095 start_codon:yes stop_codon:yes gene_type:complete
MSIPYTKSIANPSPGHYDGRNDLGYGRSDNSGLGSNWNMGDALSSPKGQWDKEEDLVLVDFEKVLNEVKNLFNLLDIEFDIEEELVVEEIEVEKIFLFDAVEDILSLFDIDIYNLEEVEFDTVEVNSIELLKQLNNFIELFEIKSSIDYNIDEEDSIEINNKTLFDLLKYSLKILDIEIDDFDSKNIGINKKMHVSLNKQASDSLSKRKTDPYSFNGLANTSQYLGASHNRKGSLIKSYIKEVLLSETGMAVTTIVKGTIGNPYPKKNAIGTMGMSGAFYIKRGGYKQSRKSTTDGGETVGGRTGIDGKKRTGSKSDEEYEIQYDENGEIMSTGEILSNTVDNTFKDEDNVSKHTKRSKLINYM